jgi:hypothetical protein
VQVLEAHGPGALAPSIHHGRPVAQGVRAMRLRHGGQELVTGGADGQLIVWDVANGALGRKLRTIAVRLSRAGLYWLAELANSIGQVII